MIKISDTVTSIFRRIEKEKLYEITDYRYKYVHMYAVPGNILADREIARYEVEMPLLEKGEQFFLHDIQEEVIIKSRMRSSDGSITYYVEDMLVETENTIRTRTECQTAIMRFKALQEEFEKYKAKYKFKHRFFNIRRAKGDV